MRREVVGVLVFATCVAVDDTATAAERHPRPPIADIVPFASTRPGEVVVPVQIGGRGPFRFLLDTGSTHTAVAESLGLQLLGLRPVARTSMTTSSGSVVCPVVQLPDVAIGSAHADGLLATVLPAAAGTLAGREVDGVIGQDFLARFDFAIDYRHSRVIWNGVTDEQPGIKLRLLPSAGRFLVALPQDETPDPPIVRLVPDSGADAIVIFGDVTAARLPLRDPGASRLTSLAGEDRVRTAVVDVLRIGSASLRGQVAAIVAAKADGEDGDGLLPLHLFARVSFNNRDGYVLIEPR